MRAAALLAELISLRDRYGEGLAGRKATLARELGRAALPSARLVERFHDTLCFLRACPDDEQVLSAVEAELARFHGRRDLARFRARLADTGIAGTPIHYRFLLPMAAWIVRRWPGALHVDWTYVGSPEALEALLPALAIPSAGSAFDEYAQPPRHWLRLLRGPEETDAEWLVRRFAALRAPASVKDALWGHVQPGFALDSTDGQPSRTQARHRASPVTFVRRPLERGRPDILAELGRAPRAVRRLTPREGEAVLDCAREAMLVRHRDLDAFSHGNPRDVRMIELGDGLQLACVGMLPPRRLLLEAVFGFLTLRNGVPIGYVLASALFNSSEVAYNVFDTWRGAESARVYGRVLATAARLFGSDTFAVDPYQLGHHNEEGLASGAWWFYQKLGFRPKDRAVAAVMDSELERMRADASHRSSRATLRRLVQAPMFFHAGRPREDVLGHLSVADVGVQVARLVAARCGADLERGADDCARDAARALGCRTIPGSTDDERAAFTAWAPLVLCLPGLETWTPAERRGLVDVIRAKGGPDELAFVRRFDGHGRLRAAIVELQRRRLSDPAPRARGR